MARITSHLSRYFLMGQQIAEADHHASAMGSIGVSQLRAARELLASAESAGNSSGGELGVIAALREALMALAVSIVLRRKEPISGDDAFETWKGASQDPEMQGAISTLSSNAREDLEELIRFGSSKSLVERSRKELSVFGESLAAVVRQLVERSELEVFAPKRLRYVRALRWIAAAFGFLLMVSLGIREVRQVFRSKPTNAGVLNVALNKSVKVSSNWRSDLYPSSRLTDGDLTQIGFHTERQLNPWVVVDLEADYAIHKIVVTNRLDGTTSFAVPLRIELSSDGDAYTEYARNENDFKVWTATGTPTEARYVRLTALKETILHLNEVEVY